jgi:hypothetical protein
MGFSYGRTVQLSPPYAKPGPLGAILMQASTMDIQFKTRPFYSNELRLLNTLKTQKTKKSSSKIKLYHFIIAVILGAGFAYVAVLLADSFWTFLFGTLAVVSFAFIIFAPYEIYKLKRKQSDFFKQLNITIEKGTVDTCIINAKKIAVANEYEDEGDLYIIEYTTDSILYLWDYDYNLQKKFPCLDFEIYDEEFHKLLGRQIYPISGRITPIVIDKEAKWNYMKKNGVPEHLKTKSISFDKLIEEYNNCA